MEWKERNCREREREKNRIKRAKLGNSCAELWHTNEHKSFHILRVSSSSSFFLRRLPDCCFFFFVLTVWESVSRESFVSASLKAEKEKKTEKNSRVAHSNYLVAQYARKLTVKLPPVQKNCMSPSVSLPYGRISWEKENPSEPILMRSGGVFLSEIRVCLSLQHWLL